MDNQKQQTPGELRDPQKVVDEVLDEKTTMLTSKPGIIPEPSTQLPTPPTPPIATNPTPTPPPIPSPAPAVPNPAVPTPPPPITPPTETTSPSQEAVPLAFVPPPTAGQGGPLPAGVKPFEPEKPKKKKGKVGLVVAGVALFLLVGTVGLAGYYYYATGESLVAYIFEGGSGIAGSNDEKPGSRKEEVDKAKNLGIDESVITGARNPAGGGSAVDVQPEGTYPVYENGASSGTVVGYRYIQAPGVFEGAITRAVGGNTADLALLKSQYGMTDANINEAAEKIADGYTWVPDGVGGVAGWHWTKCLDAGSGMNGIGCDVVKTDGGGGEEEKTVTPTLACVSLTKNKVDSAIEVGSVVTFTCAGSVTPTGATTLSYAFRLRKDAGSWQTLVANGATTSYAVATAGTYEVQCKTCGEIEGASVCDPVWEGAE